MGTRVQHHVRQVRPSLALTDLIEKPVLQAWQDRFSEKYGVSTGILDKNAEPITYERRHTSYCSEIRGTRTGYTLCRICIKNMIKDVCHRIRSEWHTCCYAGLLDFVAPIRIGGEIVAFFFLGGVRGGRGTKEAYGVSKAFPLLRRALKRGGEETQVSYASLKAKFAQIPRRTKEEIATIKAAAVEFAQDLSRILTMLEKWQRPQAVSQFVAKVARATDVDNLFDICVSEIPALLGTRYCAVLTVVRETRKAQPRLVLRKTNYSPSKRLEGTAAYRSGQGLTGWVWKNACSLRLNSISDEAELAKYPGLQWTNTICDSDEHREWLGVPLYGWRGDVIGVIRVPQKARTGKIGGGGVTFEDEVLLLKIGQYVARQIEELSAGERIGVALRASQVCAVQLSHAATRKSVAETLVAACKRIFGTSGKLHAFMMLGEDSRTFRLEASTGSLGGKFDQKMWPVHESLGGLALRRGRAVIVHDLARTQRSETYYPAVPVLACAMLAPVCFGERRYGVLSVGADRRYEFSEEPDLHILEDLSSIAGATLARLDAEEESKAAFVEFSGRMGHMLNSRIAALEGTIAVVKIGKGSRHRIEVGKLEEVVEFLKGTADLAVRFGKAWDRTRFRKFDLAATIRAIEVLWEDPRIKFSVRGPLTIIGDPELLEHAVVELVGNALRFAPTHGGEVIVRAYKRQRGRARMQPSAIVIEVEDNGPGVPQDQKESIFHPYRTRDQSRPGLGLSIVKSAAEVHKGYVQECGVPGQGACFRIVLPQPG